jgi:hypothetical protein
MIDIRFIFISVLLIFTLSSCDSPKVEDQQQNDQGVRTEDVELSTRVTPQKIVAESYTQHGCERINSASISFDFRSTHFEYQHTDTGLVRSRTFLDSAGNKIKDVWSRNRLNRYINDGQVALSTEKQAAYQSTINSVFYFAFLPKSLRDPAVNLEYLDTAVISDKSYHKIRVTFDEEGGGEDHEDVFIYWFDIQDCTMDYLAYSYIENGGGMRFRSFTNRQEIDGIVFQDYLNFAPPEGADLIDLDQLYEEGELKQVSVIELENIELN